MEGLSPVKSWILGQLLLGPMDLEDLIETWFRKGWKGLVIPNTENEEELWNICELEFTRLDTERGLRRDEIRAALYQLRKNLELNTQGLADIRYSIKLEFLRTLPMV